MAKAKPERVEVRDGVLYRADGRAAHVDDPRDRLAMAAAFKRWADGSLEDGAFDLVVEGHRAPRLRRVPGSGAGN